MHRPKQWKAEMIAAANTIERTDRRSVEERWIFVDAMDKRFGNGLLVLNNVNLTVRKGEIVCIVGPSGCGKTTLLNIVAGFEQPTGGTCEIAGEAISEPGPERGFVFQRPALFPWMTVLDNVTIGPRVRGVKPQHWLERAERLLEETGLSQFKSHFPYQISGGMAQRVQLVRVMMNEPSIVLMDEPFGALDYQTRLSMHQLLLSLHAEYRPTILFITHDVDEAVFLADRVVVMKSASGEIIREISIALEKPRSLHDYSTGQFAEYKELILGLLGFH
jgi:NitT/TauT family transport system ATP-binding protein